MDKAIADVQQHNHHALPIHQLPSPFTIKTLSIDLKEEVGDGLRRPFPSKVGLCPASPQEKKKNKLSRAYHLLGWIHHQNMGLAADRASKSRASG